MKRNIGRIVFPDFDDSSSSEDVGQISLLGTDDSLIYQNTYNQLESIRTRNIESVMNLNFGESTTSDNIIDQSVLQVIDESNILTDLDSQTKSIDTRNVKSEIIINFGASTSDGTIDNNALQVNDQSIFSNDLDSQTKSIDMVNDPMYHFEETTFPKEDIDLSAINLLSWIETSFCGVAEIQIASINMLKTALCTKSSDVIRIICDYLVKLSVTKNHSSNCGFNLLYQFTFLEDEQLKDTIYETVFECIHKIIVSVTKDKTLLSIANGSLPDDDILYGILPTPLVNLQELVNFTTESIIRIYRPQNHGLPIPSIQPCLDLCFLAHDVFKIQLEELSLNINDLKSFKTNIQIQNSQNLINWTNLFKILLKDVNKIIPSIIGYLNVANEYILVKDTNANIYKLNDKMSREDPEGCASHILSLINGIKIMLRKLLINDRLPSPELKSDALDLIISSSTVPNIINSLARNML